MRIRIVLGFKASCGQHPVTVYEVCGQAHIGVTVYGAPPICCQAHPEKIQVVFEVIKSAWFC